MTSFLAKIHSLVFPGAVLSGRWPVSFANLSIQPTSIWRVPGPWIFGGSWDLLTGQPGKSPNFACRLGGWVRPSCSENWGPLDVWLLSFKQAWAGKIDRPDPDGLCSCCFIFQAENLLKLQRIFHDGARGRRGRLLSKCLGHIHPSSFWRIWLEPQMGTTKCPKLPDNEYFSHGDIVGFSIYADILWTDDDRCSRKGTTSNLWGIIYGYL